MEIKFVKAEKKLAKIKIAITGPSGSGKTYSSLALASGLGNKIAVCDTENGSASLYSEIFNFDVINMTPPYLNEKYLAVIKAAVDAEYDVLVLDSISHQWSGDGGLLAKKESIDARGGNSYANWSAITKEHNTFLSAIINAPIHIICTMRSKTEFSIDKSESGKTTIRKVGLAPVQRDAVEFEFSAVLDVSMNHEASASKDRTNLFVDRIFKITKDTGVEVKNWLDKTTTKEEKK